MWYSIHMIRRILASAAAALTFLAVPLTASADSTTATTPQKVWWPGSSRMFISSNYSITGLGYVKMLSYDQYGNRYVRASKVVDGSANGNLTVECRSGYGGRQWVVVWMPVQGADETLASRFWDCS